MQCSRKIHRPDHTNPTMKIQRKSKDKNQPRNDQTNSSSKNRRPTTKGSIQMPTQITDIKLDRPLITTIGQGPTFHTFPNIPGGDEKDTLAGCKLLTNQPNIPSGEPSSIQEQIRIPRHTLEVHLSRQISTPRQIQSNNEPHTQKGTPAEYHHHESKAHQGLQQA